MRSLLGNLVAVCICLGATLSVGCSGTPFGGDSSGNSGGGADADGGSSAGDDGGTSADPGSGGASGSSDGGFGDAGHHDGGKGDAGKGGSGGGGASCTALSACCSQLGSQMSGGCMSIVSSGYEQSCASALDGYHNGGYCTGGTHCATLAACCPSLPPGQGWQDTCNYYVDLNNDPTCQNLIGTYQNDGYCK